MCDRSHLANERRIEELRRLRRELFDERNAKSRQQATATADGAGRDGGPESD
jgi:hypothetical protein